MPERKIFRYTVPVDDHWHTHELSGPILHVACRTDDVVEFWALHTGDPAANRMFRVVGTGQPLPDVPHLRHVGTAFAAGGALVWHLIEFPPPLPQPLPGREVCVG